MNGLDLFSGIGGISRALEPWVRTVAYCEADRYAQGVLLSRMQSGDLDVAPIWDDVRTLSAKLLPEIDIIFGGFPCQDISVAGNGVGMEAGSRSGLFSEIVRLTEEIRPSYVFLENVPAIRTRGLARVLLELTALRYDCRWTVVSAAELGAPHLRKRWFLLAHSNSDTGRIKQITWKKQQGPTDSIYDGKEESLAHSIGPGLEGSSRKLWEHGHSELSGEPWTKVKPTICGGAHGLPNRVDRIKCLGNSVVPAQAREAFMRLSGIK